LWHLGFPIVGDPAYLQGGQLGSSHTLLPSEPPMCLHSESIAFQDADRKEQKFEAPALEWGDYRAF
jgi:23S rRNA-/tRNA-specific pseudouridylate synthase